MDTETPIEELSASEDEISFAVYTPRFNSSVEIQNSKGEWCCRARVTDRSSRSFSEYQCSRKGVIEEGGYWWCKTHWPTGVHRKSEERQRAWRDGWRRRDEETARAAAIAAAERVVIETAKNLLSQKATYDDLAEAVSALERAESSSKPL